MVPMRKHLQLQLFQLLGIVAIAASGALAAQSAAATHRLEATPATVAYGHYWSETKPVLTIASGDIIDVDTLLTSVPDRLEKAGVPAADVQASLRAIVDQVKDRGPGGHILTGPVFVDRRRARRCARGESALDRSADRLRLQRLRRIHPRELRAGPRADDHPDGSQGHDGDVPAGHRHSAEAVLRQHGRGAAAGDGARQQQSAGHSRRQSRQQGAGRGHHALDPGARAGRAVRDRRRSCRAGRRRGRSNGDRNVAARQGAAHGPQGHDAGMAARGNRRRTSSAWAPTWT